MKKYNIAIITLITLFSINNVAFAKSAKKAVEDNFGGRAISTWGDCVRTKWDGNKDPCAAKTPKPKIKKPVYTPAPTPIVNRDARTIYFDFNKDNLNEKSISKLNSLINAIRGSKRILSANIVGYADKIGDSDYNIKLSRDRSSAVKSYLDKYVRIDTRIANIRALGESSPITSCSDKMNRKDQITCLAKDRRVEVEFSYNK